MDPYAGQEHHTLTEPTLHPLSAQDDGTSVFTGRFGLRAIWGLLLFFVLVVAVSLAFNSATRLAQGKPLFPGRATSKQTPAAAKKRSSANVNPRGTAIGGGTGFLAIAVVCVSLARIERRRFRVFGIGKNRQRDFLPGAFWGLALLSALVGILRAYHLLVFDGRALSGTAVYVFGAKWLLAFLCVGLIEEYLTRGYIQYTLTRGFFTMAERISPAHARGIAFWAAAVVMSCVFGAGHLSNPGESTAGIIAVFCAGMVFSYSLWHTGSLWWAIGFHMAWDWAQSFLYGVPDSGALSGGRLFNTHPTGNPLLSGGSAGPEGSLFVLPTLLLVVIVVRFTTKTGAQPALEPLAKTHSLPSESTPVIA